MRIQRNETYSFNKNYSPYTNKRVTFRANTSPAAMAKARDELLKELNINTGESVFIQGIKKFKGQVNWDVLHHFFDSIKKIIPLADSVEKLKLLKTHATSIISVDDNMTREIAEFLKSDKATDKNIYLLDCAMNYNKANRERKWLNDENIDWHYEGSYRPVYDYLMKGTSLDKLKIDLSVYQPFYADSHDNRLLRPFGLYENETFRRLRKRQPLKDEDVGLIFRVANYISENREILEGNYFKEEEYALPSRMRYNIISEKYLFPEIIHYKSGSKRIIMRETDVPLFFSDKNKVNWTSDSRLAVYLDKDNNLLQTQMFIFDINSLFAKEGEYSSKYTDGTTLSDGLRRWLLGITPDIGHEGDSFYKNIIPTTAVTDFEESLYDSINLWKYNVYTISYDARTGIADYKKVGVATKNELESGSGWIGKYKKIDVPDDTEGAFGEEGKKFTFYPLTPTPREIFKMIKGEKDNNLIQMINGSDWAPAFLKLINDGKISKSTLRKSNIDYLDYLHAYKDK